MIYLNIKTCHLYFILFYDINSYILAYGVEFKLNTHKTQLDLISLLDNFFVQTRFGTKPSGVNLVDFEFLT